MKMVVNLYKQAGTIHPNLYGHFAEHLGRCIYDGLYVGEASSIPNTEGIRTDVLEALKAIRVPVLRWPGGLFADEYDWMDGIGPKDKRPRRVNSHWGKVEDSNHFGTHEFLRLCELLGCEPYINANVGSGSIDSLRRWIEYVSYDGDSEMAALRRENGREKPWRVKYWGIGNENWLGGGQMRAEYYADKYRNYQSYVREYAGPIYKIGCGPLDDDYHWTDVMMREAGEYLDAITLHYYTYPGHNVEGEKGESTRFGPEEWYTTLAKTLRIEEMIDTHLGVMRRWDPAGRVGLIVDEWGCWYNVEPGTNPGFLYQQNTLRDAVVAAVNLNIFNRRCRRIHMANIAQMVNVLQAPILTQGAEMLLTPTYYVYDLYKAHQGALLADSYLESEPLASSEGPVPSLHHSASVAKGGRLHLTLASLHDAKSQEVELSIVGGGEGPVEGRVLTGAAVNAHNTFEAPNAVRPTAFTDFGWKGGVLRFTVPARSVLSLTIESKQTR